MRRCWRITGAGSSTSSKGCLWETKTWNGEARCVLFINYMELLTEPDVKRSTS
jgi:hypothetical protein